MNSNLRSGTLQHKIVELLNQNPGGGLTSKEISQCLNRLNNSVSGSLSVLEKKGLVSKIVDSNSPDTKYISSSKLTVLSAVEQEFSPRSNLINVEMLRERLNKVRMEAEQLRREEENLATTLEVLTQFIV
ncbi:MAG: hypothetical protein RM021_024335 [Nostoc sp. EkiNYC01]|nr:hypothetical protein [Nostoc sp. EkiNYC01]